MRTTRHLERAQRYARWIQETGRRVVYLYPLSGPLPRPTIVDECRCEVLRCLVGDRLSADERALPFYDRLMALSRHFHQAGYEIKTAVP